MPQVVLFEGVCGQVEQFPQGVLDLCRAAGGNGMDAGRRPEQVAQGGSEPREALLSPASTVSILVDGASLAA